MGEPTSNVGEISSNAGAPGPHSVVTSPSGSNLSMADLKASAIVSPGLTGGWDHISPLLSTIPAKFSAVKPIDPMYCSKGSSMARCGAGNTYWGGTNVPPATAARW